MKKKVMQTWFIVLFIVGIVVGWLLPGNFKELTKQMTGDVLKTDIFDVPKRLGQLDQETEYFKYTVIAETETGSIELLRLDERIPLHRHPKENHFVYVYKGRAKGTVGDVTAEVGPGQIVAIPAGVPHSFERIGDSPVEIILFSTPPFMPGDIQWLEQE
ncbi:cupin domain-containing protein [Candidatus Woesearchaeota archaeon]|nr:cupin domain-containing protein [Candidatus Woesearchaeota archaeon]